MTSSAGASFNWISSTREEGRTLNRACFAATLARLSSNSFIEYCNHKAVGYINRIISKKSNYEQTNIEIHTNIEKLEIHDL